VTRDPCRFCLDLSPSTIKFSNFDRCPRDSALSAPTARYPTLNNERLVSGVRKRG